MPVEYVVLNQGALVLEFWTGTISHDEVLAHERRHLSDSSIAPGASVLVDAIRASFETTLEAVHEVTDLYRRSGKKVESGEIRHPGYSVALRSCASIREASKRLWCDCNPIQFSGCRLYMVGDRQPDCA